MSSVDSMGAAIPRDFALGEICDLSYGKALPRESRDPDGLFPAVGSAGIVSYTDSALVQEPALVVGRKGNVGSIQVFESGCFPLDTTYVLRPHGQVNLDYLAWALRSKNLVSLDSSTTLPSLRRQDLQAVRLTVPPLDEQKRIVAQLEDQLGKLEAVRARLTATKTQLDRLRASMLNLYLGNWARDMISSESPIVRLGDVVSPRKTKVQPTEFVGKIFLGLEHVEPHSGKITALENAEKYRSAANQARRGDVLYGRLRPYLNKVVVADQDLLASGEFIVLPSTDHIISGFLHHVLMSPSFLEFTALLDTGDRPRVSWEGIRNFEFALPPLHQQRSIVEEFDQTQMSLDGIGSRVSEVNSLIESTRSSILHRAFLPPGEGM